MSARNIIPQCPPGWHSYTIGEILSELPNGSDLHQGWSPQCKSTPAAPGEWGVLKTTAIQPGAFEPQHNKALPGNLEPRPDIVVEVGDLLLTCAGPRGRCGVPCLIRRTPPRLMMSGKMYRFRPRPHLAVPAFIEAQLLAQPWQDALDDMKTGISDSGLNLTHGRFRKLPIHLPPVPVQHRIVASIEAHSSRLDAAIASLTSAKAKVKRARASVLKAAVEGRLVPTEAALARAEGRDYEPASVLLGRILAERKAKWTASGAKGKYKDPEGPDVEEIPGIPVGWVWATVDQICVESLTNGRSVPTRDEGFPVLRLTAMNNGVIDFREAKGGDWTQEDAEPWLIERGDFFIMRGNGSLTRVGSPAIAGEVPRPIAFPDTMIRLRTQRHLAEPRYLLLAWRSPFMRSQIEASARTTAGIHKVNQASIAKYRLPLPPLAEQHRIVLEVDRRLSVLDALDASIDANLARCARLRQAILKRAFEGRLVPAEALVDD